MALLPDDLAAQEQAEALENVDHVTRERAVGLAAEIGDVYRHAASGLELGAALREDVVQHLQVRQIVGGHRSHTESSLVLFTGEVGRGRHHQGHRLVGDVAVAVHVAGVTYPDDVLRPGRRHVGVVGDYRCGEARVEVRRVMALAPADAEPGGSRGSPLARAAQRLRRSHTPSLGSPARRAPAEPRFDVLRNYIDSRVKWWTRHVSCGRGSLHPLGRADAEQPEPSGEDLRRHPAKEQPAGTGRGVGSLQDRASLVELRERTGQLEQIRAEAMRRQRADGLLQGVIKREQLEA